MSETQRHEAPSLHLDPELPPLRVDEGGVVRVGRGRITLDLVVEQYENGMTPEDLVRAYDTLKLADVYGAIAYYLRHREEVASYMDHREQEASRLQAMHEMVNPRVSRKELISRAQQRGKRNAPAGQ